MEKRKPVRRGRAFYEDLLAERERDGLSYQALSERTGVPLSSLQRWGRRLAQESAPIPERFVEIVAKSSAEAGRVEVLLRSGHTLFLEPGPPGEGLADLVALLEAC